MVNARDETSGSSQRRGQRQLIRIAMMSQVSGALLGQVGALFLMSLGATPFQIGLLATSTHVQKVARFGGVHAMPQLGKVHLFFWGRIAALPPLALLIGLALRLGPGPTAVWTALLVLALRGVLQQAGNAAWWPLIQDNAASNAIGRFLARMRVRQRLLGIIAPLGVGWYLGAAPAAQRFAPLFLLALVAAAISGWMVRYVAEQPATPAATATWRRLLETVRDRRMQRYMAFVLARMGVHALSFPFWVVVLTGRGMPAGHFVFMTSIMALGNMGGQLWWGKLVDAHGSRPALSLSLLLQAAMAGAWLLLPGRAELLLLWGGIVFFLRGVFDGGVQMGQSRAMIAAVPDAYQAEGFAVAIHASAMGGVLGALLGGACFSALRAHGGGGTWETAYLAAAQLGLVGVWGLSRLLDGHATQTSVAELLRRAAARPR